MSSDTKENLDKLLKKDLISIKLAPQPKMSAANAEVLEEIRKLSSKFDIMQSDLSMRKKVNSELSSRLVNMECQCSENGQYSSKNFFEGYRYSERC